MSDVKISALPVGVATSSTPFPAVVGGVTDQVTLAPVYTSLAGKAATSHTHVESDVTGLVTDLATRLIGLTAFASLPAAGSAGAVYFFTDSPYVARDNGVTYDYFFQGIQSFPLDDSGGTWAWDNQGTASIVHSGGLTHLIVPSATTNLRVRYETAPATPWTLTVLLRAMYFGAGNLAYTGIALRDGTGKIYIFYITDNRQFQAVRFTNATTFSAIGPVNSTFVAAGMWHWLRVTDDGTNISFHTSIDGVNFRQSGVNESRTAFFGSGPTQFGIFGNVDTNGPPFTVTFASYKQA